MITQIQIVFCFLICLKVVFSEKKLIKLIEVARHGARSPYFNYLDAKDWGVDLKQLTRVGMRHHFLIGRQMRKRYIDELKFLSPQFDQNEIQILCKSAQRTIMSAQCQMYGLYFQKGRDMQQNWKFQASTDLPPFNVDPQYGQEIIEQIQKKNLPNEFQPVPLYAFPEDFQNVILETDSSCEKIEDLQEENTKSMIYQQFENKLIDAGYYQKFREVFDVSDKTPVDMRLTGRFYDTLYSDKFQQRSFPKKLDKDFYDMMEFVYSFRMLYYDFGTDLVIKLKSTKLIDSMLNFIQEGTQKFMFYSGSDNNINELNIALNVVSYSLEFEDWKKDRKKHSNAGFASNIFIEIYQDEFSKQKYARYIYNGDVQLSFGDCRQQYCEIEVFTSSLLRWTMSDKEFINNCKTSTLKEKL